MLEAHKWKNCPSQSKKFQSGDGHSVYPNVSVECCSVVSLRLPLTFPRLPLVAIAGVNLSSQDKQNA